MKVKDLIRDLSKLSEEHQDLDVCIVAQNGLLLSPDIRFKKKNKYDVLNNSIDNIEKVVLTWSCL